MYTIRKIKRFVLTVSVVICTLFLVTIYEFYNDLESGFISNDVNHIIKGIFLEEGEIQDYEVFNVFNRKREVSEKVPGLSPPCTGINKDVNPRSELDLFQEGPFSFDTGFTNPCWYGTVGGLRCLPYFYLAGMPKCGTTNLFTRLIRHPDISRMSRGQHWLTRDRFKDPKQTFDWWTADNFIVETWNRTNRSEDSKLIPDIVGDGTVSTFWDYSNWRFIPGNENCSEPRITNPHLVHHLNPDSKIIVMLRNPTERAYSDFLYFDGTKNTTVQEFHKYCYQSIKIIKECMKKFGVRYCIFNNAITDQMKVRLHIGMYSAFMKEWLNVFNKDRILAIRLEELSKNPGAVLTEAFDFLGVAPLSTKQLLNILSSENKNEGRRKLCMSDMLPETQDMLNDFYSIYNMELALLMNDVHYTW